MIKKRALACLPAALILSGCMSLAPDLTKSEGVIPNEFTQNGIYENNKVGVVSVEDLKWNNYIQDNKLKELIQLSLDNNKDLKIAIANISAAKAQYGITEIDRLPMINAEISGNKSRIETGIVENYQANLGLASFEIDAFGRVKNLSDAALNKFLATQEAKKVTELSIIAATSQAYFDVGLAKTQLDIAKKTEQATKESLDIMKQRVKHGIASSKDQKDLESIYYLAKSDVLNYETSVAKGINALRFLIGSSFNESLLPNNINDIKDGIKDINVAVNSDVLYNRPDVMAAEYQLISANANIGAARAAFFPRISLTTSAGVASGDLSSLFSDNFRVWSFVPKIQIPVFDTARNNANLKISEAQKEIAIAQYDKTVQQAFREVNDALARKSTINEQIQNFNKHVQANEERLKLSNKTYEAGIQGYLSVLTARTDLYKAELSQLMLEKEKFDNMIFLYKSLSY